MKHDIFLALGSNIADKKAYIEKAIAMLDLYVSDIKVAPFYSTNPIGFIDQDTFVNTALYGHTTLDPEALLKGVKAIEKQIGRVERFRWGPREIDIDIIFYDQLIFKNDHLEIPHPRAVERDFVLCPIAQLDASFIHPIEKKTITELLSMIPKAQLTMITSA